MERGTLKINFASMPFSSVLFLGKGTHLLIANSHFQFQLFPISQLSPQLKNMPILSSQNVQQFPRDRLALGMFMNFTISGTKGQEGTVLCHEVEGKH